MSWRPLSEMRIRGPIWETKHTIRQHRTATKLRIHNSTLYSTYIAEPTSKGLYFLARQLTQKQKLNGRRATQCAQHQLVAGLVQHCSKGGATYHLSYTENYTFEMSGSFRVEFCNKYRRIRRVHMSASPRFSQFDVYFFYL